MTNTLRRGGGRERVGVPSRAWIVLLVSLPCFILLRAFALEKTISGGYVYALGISMVAMVIASVKLHDRYWSARHEAVGFAALPIAFGLLSRGQLVAGAVAADSLFLVVASSVLGLALMGLARPLLGSRSWKVPIAGAVLFATLDSIPPSLVGTSIDLRLFAWIFGLSIFVVLIMGRARNAQALESGDLQNLSPDKKGVGRDDSEE